MNNYEFSEIYDILMKEVSYNKWSEFIHKRLDGKKDILEIGCGTGEITKRLGEKNYKITAVEPSENMLVKAYEKLRKIPNIRIMKGDGRSIQMDKKFDAVVSACDVVNYMLKDKDLEDFIVNSWNLLKEDGMIIFDISSYNKLKNILGNNTFVSEEEGIFYVWENNFVEEKDISEMTLNFFIKDGDSYKRITEVQSQRAFKVEKVKEVLEEKGFKDVKIYEDYRDKNIDDESERIVFTGVRR